MPLQPANTTLKVYPADTPIFDRTSVSLQLPDELFSNTFTTATNASKLIGNLIKNSARRFSYFAWFFKPIFGDALVIKDTAALKLLKTTTTLSPDSIGEVDDLEATTLEPEVTTLEENLVDTTVTTMDDVSNDIL